LEVNISEQGKWERVIEITVPYQEMAHHFDKAYVTYKKKIQLEGFRKGKVPISLIKQMFGLKIEQETAENVAVEYLEEAAKQEHLRLFDISKLDTIDYSREKGLHLKAVVKIQPEIELTKYKGLEVENEIYQVTDDDIRETIERLREQQATMVDIEDEAKRGHYIVADIQETNETGVPIVGQKYENRYFQLESTDPDDQFVEQLIGVKPGETRNISIVEPSADPDSDKPEVKYFSIAVKEVKEKVLPEIDDEFARDVGDYQNLDELKASIRQELEQQAAENSKQNLSHRVMDEAIKSNPVELPDYMIDNFLDRFVKNARQNGGEAMDEQELRDRYRADAIWNLKWVMIKDKIMEMENIEVSDKEVMDYIEDLAKKAGKNATMVRSNYRDPKKREQIKLKIEEDKVVDLLIENAQLVDKVVTYQDQKRAEELIV